MQEEPDEIIDWYLNTKNSARVQVDPSDIERRLDPVDPQIVGNIDLKRILALPVVFVVLAVRYLLSGGIENEDPGMNTKVGRIHSREAVQLLAQWGMVAKKRAKCGVGLFFVPKKDDKLRIIIDARSANEKLQRFGMLTLFSLRDLLVTWTLFESVVVLDMRHFFWQIALGENLQQYFGLMEFCLRVVPMGWHSAPYLAQCIAYAIVLYKEAGQDDLGVQLDGKEMPKFLEIRRGGKVIGRLLVLIDGIAIATRCRTTRRLWEKRIQTNMKRLRVALKNRIENEFCGVRFGAQGWQAIAKVGRLSEEPTRREVAQVLGSILWILRVRCCCLLEEEELMRMFSAVGKEGGQWDASYKLTEQEVRLLEKKIQECNSDVWTAPEALGEEGRGMEKRKLYMVTDATPVEIAWLEMENGGVKKSGSRTIKGDQVIQELRAVVSGVEEATRNMTHVKVIVGCDAEIVRRVVEKMYSKSEQLREELRNLNRMKKERNLEIEIKRVPGEENAANELSRGKDTILDKVKQTWERIRN